MFPFEYHRAESIDQASEMLHARPDAKVLAGGMSLVPMLKLRLAQTSDIIDLGYLNDLRGIEVTPDRVEIRAMTSHATVAASPEVRKALPALADLAGGIGDPHCRNRGTIGGSLAHSDPAACYPAAVLALGATINTNRRSIGAGDFFKSSFETSLDHSELITSVSFPIAEKAAYIKFQQPASRFALVGIFVAKLKDRVGVAVTGCGQKVFRMPEFEAALAKRFEERALDSLEVGEAGLNTDIFADPEYRAHLIKVLSRRAVATCSKSAA